MTSPNFYRRPSMFSTSSSSRNLYQQPYAQAGGNPPVLAQSEIDLRAELDEIFFGYASGIRHGYMVLIRDMRRTSNGSLIDCTCKDAITREPDPDCSYCFGEGFLCEERYIWTYSTYATSSDGLANKGTFMPPGNVRMDLKVFYFRYDADIKYGDKIVEIELDEEGNMVVPYVRETIYKPHTIGKFRSDNSRIEYYAVYCREEDAIRPDVYE